MVEFAMVMSAALRSPDCDEALRQLITAERSPTNCKTPRTCKGLVESARRAMREYERAETLFLDQASMRRACQLAAANTVSLQNHAAALLGIDGLVQYLDEKTPAALATSAQLHITREIRFLA